MVGIFLDLDNLNPGRASPERAAVMAHRLREAARQLGGGALGGVAPDDDARAPALVVAFRAFGNAETVSPAIAEALEAAGAEVCRVEGAEPDAADLALGANLDAFANAWAADASAPPPPGFLTERVVDALRREAAASSLSRAPDAESESEARRVAADDAERAALAAAAERASRIAEGFASARAALVPASRRALPAVALLATNDTDLVPCVEYARERCGLRVVVLGDFLPRVEDSRRGQRAKRARPKRRGRAFAGDPRANGGADPRVGVTRSYWSAVQAASSARPVGNLKLPSSADAALVWDATRAFALDGSRTGARRPEGDDDAGFEGATGGTTTKPVPGGVVGIWRREGAGRGVGAWPSPRAAVLHPRE